jgi:hypothetical protein
MRAFPARISTQDLSFGFGLLFFAMAVISQGAIVHAAAQSMGRLNTGTVHVDRAWHAGVKHMWPLIVIHGFKKFSLTVLGLFLGWASFSAVFAPSLVDVLLFWFLFIAVIIVFISPTTKWGEFHLFFSCFTRFSSLVHTYPCHLNVPPCNYCLQQLTGNKT